MKTPKLSRNQWLFLALLLFLTGQVAYHIWSHWGLITVHSKNLSLSQVIRSIEKQGHVSIKTNMDLTKPVQMNVDEVSLAEALETLSVTTDSRWRLVYFVAPDNGALNTALANFTAGQHNEGWRTLFVPLPPVGEPPAVLPDPRKDSWAVKPVKEANLLSYLQQAAKNVSATFVVPDAFNPTVKSPPRSGAITSALPRLASNARAKYQEVFLLQGSGRTSDRGEGDRRDRGDDGEPRFAGNFGGDSGRSRGGFDRDAFEERIQNEINKLPPADRVAAQQEHDERKKFFDSLKDMTPDQRSAAFQQMMSDPGMQDKMEAAKNDQAGRQSPQQRMARAQSYLQKKAQFMNAGK